MYDKRVLTVSPDAVRPIRDDDIESSGAAILIRHVLLHVAGRGYLGGGTATERNAAAGREVPGAGTSPLRTRCCISEFMTAYLYEVHMSMTYAAAVLWNQWSASPRVVGRYVVRPCGPRPYRRKGREMTTKPSPLTLQRQNRPSLTPS